MRVVIQTLGTRGDVQPYVALGVGLQARGHQVTLATVAEFEGLAQSYGLPFAPLRGDFLKAAQSAEGRANPLKLMREFVVMARDTLDDEWHTAQGAEVYIYNSAALGGEHIAERLGVPSFAAFPAPLYTPTSAFPNPFFPFGQLGPFNRLSHQLLARMGPAMYGRPIRDWRREVLGLPPARGEVKVNGRPIPLLYGYSEAVVPRPTDWPGHVLVAGYWLLDSPAAWQPPAELTAFLEAGPPPVYIGFGSMYMAGGAKTTSVVVQALRQAGLRAVVATGWGGLAADQANDHLLFIQEAPHAWLFPRVAAVVHHGGAGTTGAGLRAGRPTLVCPQIGDQLFWGRRVAALGAGPAPLPRGQLTAERLAAALRTLTTDAVMRERAAELGARLQAEDGVARAVDFIEQLQ